MEYVSANLVHIDRLVLCELVIIFYIGSQSRARLAWPAVGSAPDCEPGVESTAVLSNSAVNTAGTGTIVLVLSAVDSNLWL